MSLCPVSHDPSLNFLCAPYLRPNLCHLFITISKTITVPINCGHKASQNCNESWLKNRGWGWRLEVSGTPRWPRVGLIHKPNIITSPNQCGMRQTGSNTNTTLCLGNVAYLIRLAKNRGHRGIWRKEPEAWPQTLLSSRENKFGIKLTLSECQTVSLNVDHCIWHCWIHLFVSKQPSSHLGFQRTSQTVSWIGTV